MLDMMHCLSFTVAAAPLALLAFVIIPQQNLLTLIFPFFAFVKLSGVAALDSFQ